MALAEEIERLRLENETLSAVVGVVASGPDLSHILDRVVDLLTRATDCHACFVYLRAGERLEMRAASPIYTHLVGRISFGVDEGLAGWAVRKGEAAFIREGATEDPRTHYVPELEEERFQSMVAVPIPARDGAAIGAIVLHTVAPREFDERILNVLSRAASLVAGAIENARLYEDSKERVAALTRLAGLGREVAAVGDRKALFKLAGEGIRRLIDAEVVRVYAAEGPGGTLARVGSDPEAGPGEDRDEGELVATFLEDGGSIDGTVRARLLATLAIDDAGAALDAVELSVGGEATGAVLAASGRPWPETTPELLRAAAQQVALAAEKIGLIEHLTEENLARDLFDALATGDLQVASRKIESARLQPLRPRFVLEAKPIDPSRSWSEDAVELERDVRAALPEAFCDLSSGLLRALVPVAASGMAEVRPLLTGIGSAGVLGGCAIGASEARTEVDGMAIALREADDATAIAARLGHTGDPMLYRDTGAYRYLIGILDNGGPRDHLQAAVDAIAAYDRERGTQLVHTLDEYLSSRGNVAATSRALFIHVNTLRQRLDRIEELTGLRIADEDFLALQLAVKLGRLRS